MYIYIYIYILHTHIHIQAKAAQAPLARNVGIIKVGALHPKIDQHALQGRVHAAEKKRARLQQLEISLVQDLCVCVCVCVCLYEYNIYIYIYIDR